MRRTAMKQRTRRDFLKTTAAGAAAPAAIAGFPHVRTSHAAGQLTLAIWDHWVPGANDVHTQLCNEWGAKNKVEVKIDYITSIGSKVELTAAAGARATTRPAIISPAT